MRNISFQLGSIITGIGVGLGAFGAHGLKARNLSSDLLQYWQTATFYLFIHSIGMLINSLAPTFSKFSMAMFFIGILLFSGSLYVIVLTGEKWYGRITPIGGLSFILGWIWLALVNY
jgi:uncharacterized membrane protein YgdD (TMEM256/DUF423 family)